MQPRKWIYYHDPKADE